MLGLLKRKRVTNETSGIRNPSEWLVSALLDGLKSQSGVDVTTDSVLGLSAHYACVNVISESIATLPVRLYRKEGDKRTQQTDHPLYEVLAHTPNSEMTGVDFRRVMQVNLSQYGVAYAQILRNGQGVSGLYPIDPRNIEPKRKKDKTLYYELTNELSGEELPKEKVFVIKGMTSNGINPRSPIGTLPDVFGLAQALDLDAMKFFGNGCRLGAVLEHPGSLSEKAYERLKKDFDENHSGAENAYRFKILEEGMKLVQSRSINRDSQFDESRARQALEICRIHRVPPHKIQILDNATFSNIEEQNIDWVSDCLMPKAIVWEASCNQLLSKNERAQGYYFKMDLRGLMRGKEADRAEFYSKGINAGWLMRNEARALEDLDPIDGLDEPLIPLNMVSNNEPPEENG